MGRSHCFLALAAVLLMFNGVIAAEGPLDPDFDPAVQSHRLASNIRVGGPFADHITGAREWFTTFYYYGKGGNDLMDTQWGNDVVFGMDGNDGLYGEDGNDTLVGGAGDDTIVGGPGNDIMYGGPGNDYMDGDPCGIGNFCTFPSDPLRVQYDDWIYGGPGNDTIIGRLGRDEIYGGPGDDRINGNDDDDYVSGDEGNDSVFGEKGDDYLLGGPGDDILFAGSGVDTLYGGPGNDILRGAGGTNLFVIDAQYCGETDQLRYFTPDNGDQIIVVAGPGSKGRAILARGVKSIVVKTVKHTTGIYMPGCAVPIATIFTGTRAEYPVQPVIDALILQRSPPPPPKWIRGYIPEPVPGKRGVPPVPADGILMGSPFGDEMYGFNSSATFTNYIWGFNLNDILVGGPGPDFIIGGGHNDTIIGGDGDDALSGGPGYDTIFGGGGRDALFGGHNVDILYGGGWGNWITGGDYPDWMYFDDPASCDATGPEPDVVNDFDTDRINIVGSLTSLTQLSIFEDQGSTFVALADCSTPFIKILNVVNFPLGNIQFTTTVPQKLPPGFTV